MTEQEFYIHFSEWAIEAQEYGAPSTLKDFVNHTLSMFPTVNYYDTDDDLTVDLYWFIENNNLAG